MGTKPLRYKEWGLAHPGSYKEAVWSRRLLFLAYEAQGAARIWDEISAGLTGEVWWSLLLIQVLLAHLLCVYFPLEVYVGLTWEYVSRYWVAAPGTYHT